MYRSARIALIVGLVASTAFADEVGVAQDVPRIALLAEQRADFTEDAALARYTGRYDAADGTAFVVLAEGEQLTIELPERFAAAELQLRAESASDFVAVETGARVEFALGAGGCVNGLVFHAAQSAEAVAAVRTPFPSGTVTIHDVYGNAGEIIAASN